MAQKEAGDRHAYGDLPPPCRKATLLETAPGVDVATVVAATQAEPIIADGIREMPS